MNLEEPSSCPTSTGTRHAEGITCIVCHRVDPLGKISGPLPIVEGSLYDRCSGDGQRGAERASRAPVNLQTDPERARRGVHATYEFFPVVEVGHRRCATTESV